MSQPSASAPVGAVMPVTWQYVNGGAYASAFSITSITTGGATLAIVPSGSTLWKNFCDRGGMTKANRLFRLGPFRERTPGATPPETIMSSRSSLVRRPELDTVASIMASSTAATTVTWNG